MLSDRNRLRWAQPIIMTGLLLGLGLWLTACGSDGGSQPATGEDHAAPEQNAATGRIRALSYNVAGLLEATSGEEASRNAPLISPLLNDYDLVLLQEDWEDPLQQMTAPLSPDALPVVLGYHHLIVAQAEHPFRSQPARHPLGLELRRGLDGILGPTLLSDGLNRLSSSAFGELQRIMWRRCYGSTLVTPLQALIVALGLDEFSEPAGLTGDEGLLDDGAADCGAQKGFSVATHEAASNVMIDVYNLHADAGGHDLDLEARVDNFQQLADFIANGSTGRAVILGGDTNLRFDSSRRQSQRESDASTWQRFLTEADLTDVCEVLDCGDVDERVAQGFKVHDRFAFRSGGGITLRPVSHAFEREKFTRDDGEQMSDHDPVAVIFEWRADR